MQSGMHVATTNSHIYTQGCGKKATNRTIMTQSTRPVVVRRRWGATALLREGRRAAATMAEAGAKKGSRDAD